LNEQFLYKVIQRGEEEGGEEVKTKRKKTRKRRREKEALALARHGSDRLWLASPHLASALPRLSFASASARLCVFLSLGLRRPTVESEKTSSRAPPLLSLHTKQGSLSRPEGSFEAEEKQGEEEGGEEEEEEEEEAREVGAWRGA
jgi:hypothetical protein